MDIWAVPYQNKYIIHFLTPRAKEWVRENERLADVPPESQLWLSQSDYADFCQEATDNGLTVAEQLEGEGN